MTQATDESSSAVMFPCLVCQGSDPSCQTCAIHTAGFCKVFCNFLSKKIKKVFRQFQPLDVDDFLSLFFEKVRQQAPTSTATAPRQYVKLLSVIYKRTRADFYNPRRNRMRTLVPGYYTTEPSAPVSAEQHPSAVQHTRIRDGQAETQTIPSQPLTEQHKIPWQTVSIDDPESYHNIQGKYSGMPEEWESDRNEDADLSQHPDTLHEVLKRWITSEEPSARKRCATLLYDWLEKSATMKDLDIAEIYGISANNYTQKKKRCIQLLRAALLEEGAE